MSEEWTPYREDCSNCGSKVRPGTFHNLMTRIEGPMLEVIMARTMTFCTSYCMIEHLTDVPIELWGLAEAQG